MTDSRFLSPQFLLFARRLANTPPFPADNDGIKFNFALQQWELSPFGGAGEANTSSNVGGGAGLALPKVGVDLPFKSLLGNPEIVLTPTATTIDFSIGLIAQSKIISLVADLLTKIETLTNVGTGSEIAKAKVGVNVDIRKINGTSPIVVTQNTNDITISTGVSAGLVFAKVVKSADETVTNSSVLQDDNELFFTPAINKSYNAIMWVSLQASSVTPQADFKYALSLPTGAIAERGRESWSSTNARDTQDATTSQSPSVSSTDIKWLAIPYRIVMGGTAGNIIFQWSQDVARNNDMTVLKGSLLLVFEE